MLLIACLLIDKHTSLPSAPRHRSRSAPLPPAPSHPSHRATQVCSVASIANPPSVPPFASPLPSIMHHQTLSPHEELSASALFLPIPSFYERKLREASHPTIPDRDDDICSEPSDDGAERRYSDVSFHSDRTLLDSTTNHTNNAFRPIPQPTVLPSQHLHPCPRVKPQPIRETPAFIVQAKPLPKTSTALPSSNLPRQPHSTTLPPPQATSPRSRLKLSKSPFINPFQSTDVEPPYTLCTATPSTSTPSFEFDFTHPKKFSNANNPKPKPDPPTPRTRRASLWNLFTSKRSHRKRPNQHHDASHQASQEPHHQLIRLKSLKLMRRSSLRTPSAYPTSRACQAASREASAATAPSSGQKRRSSRSRCNRRSSAAASNAVDNYLRASHTAESLSFSHLAHPPRDRIAYYTEDKREASSFAGYRGRIFFSNDGSSVSSSSDREEDAAHFVPDSNIYEPEGSCVLCATSEKHIPRNRFLFGRPFFVDI